MGTTIVFETHALSEDNERGIASGWAHGRLTERGRRLAAELGERRWNDSIDRSPKTSPGRKAGSTRRGTYRVVYRIDDTERIVQVLDVDHRRDVYKPR